MRYFYTRVAGKIVLDAVEVTGEYEIESLEDPRIKLGSIQEFTTYTGWLEIEGSLDEPAGQPQLPLDEEDRVASEVPLPRLDAERM